MQIPYITTCLEKYSFHKVLSLIIFVLRKNKVLELYIFLKKRILAFHTKNTRVVVLGKTGCNFAAGMSGGPAYVLDEMQLFDTLCNLDMVELENIWRPEDKEILHVLIEKHLEWTTSERARFILDNWQDVVGKFVKVVPIEYRKALENMRAAEQRHTETTPATEEVF